MCNDHAGIGTPGATSAAPGSPVNRRLVLGGAVAAAVGGLSLLGAGPAAAATSQNGWPASTSLPLSTLTVGAVTFPQGVRSGAPHTILGYVARRFNSEVEALRKGECWGYNFRKISGSTSYSNHASGTAIDVNAPEHFLGASGTFSAAQVRAIRSILSACDGVVRWGGDYSNRKDEMHFELVRGPGDPAVAALARKLGGGSSTPPPAPSGPTWRVVRRGKQGYYVTALQRLLRQHGRPLTIDGVFGSGTEAQVVAFQKSRGLAADGVVGVKTWTALQVTRRDGGKGQAVFGLQHCASVKGFRTAQDGLFGPKTKTAIVSFQRSRGLVADGVVGPRTWAALVA
ncbi:peptidoglycan-binding protein [Arthrobacter cupressi]|uniref:Peptidoglycan-binding (PGRP) domain of peptidoglycan hydrolases-containing protein n=1 Tax=Arthrobacter cupressi TaxID=1045773 RepID=A0A1G8HQI5_9MICC|nr:peptidoglycan-binding protein [Arthrobacter cupressi]NYD78780.1 hypothetical protein [Arthrobacter cupressi]SDI08943.1 Peptidoglycan-binding (PGRP) domain of peptidoglycan hydrolases-containing protein [Arthrobacter cupressi]